jgi:hypothetical protein
MSSNKLIEIAAAKGYNIGRERRGVYYYGKGADRWSFVGCWNDFTALVKAL